MCTHNNSSGRGGRKTFRLVSFQCFVMAAVDSSFAVMDDNSATINSVANKANATGKEEAANDRLDPVDGGTAAKDKDARDEAESADAVAAEDSEDGADATGRRGLENDELMDCGDQSAKDEKNGSDGDGTNEGSCLEAMTSDGQDHYLRLGDTPRRRSALRLSRIIARKQLLQRLARGQG